MANSRTNEAIGNAKAVCLLFVSIVFVSMMLLGALTFLCLARVVQTAKALLSTPISGTAKA